ncbi:MAG: Gfo/Idh/MocA family oxidoreductase [Spirochaetes bacterium]|nr:Gfo/Idh/MocA family oxidoreductase [Spirochaetota bacterium]
MSTSPCSDARKGAALIGCGRIGVLLENDPLRYKPCTHYGGLTAAGLRAGSACDIDGARLVNFGRRAGIAPQSLYTDFRELLGREKPPLVIIATWTGSHAEIGIRACAAGARVIVCEKPMAHNLAHAGALLRACKKSGTRLIVNHERRYDHRYRKVRDLIAGGTIGEVRSVRASILSSGYRGKSTIGEGGGPLMHDGTHMVDIIRYFFGEIESVSGEFERRGRKIGYEDRAVAWLRTRSGVDVFLEAGGNRRYFMFDLDISGSDGRIVIGNGYQRLYRSRKSRLYAGFRDLAEVPFPKTRERNCFTEVYRQARAALSGKEVDILSSGEDGYRAVEAIHAVYYSAHIRKKIDLPLTPAKVDLDAIFSLRSGKREPET